MRFQTDLVPARLTRRYKRFLADCVLEDSGVAVTAHCANPGSMLGLADPGTRVWLEPNDNPKKKLKFGWRLVDHENGHFTGVDTGLPNRIVRAALEARQFEALRDYGRVRPEVLYGSGSRVDFLLEGETVPDVYVEVKSVTLSRQQGIAEFPDSVTARGTKHLGEMAGMARAGHRAIVLYLVQRTDCFSLRLASDIDPVFTEAARAAAACGVETLVYGTNISPRSVALAAPMVFET